VATRDPKSERLYHSLKEINDAFLPSESGRSEETADPVKLGEQLAKESLALVEQRLSQHRVRHGTTAQRNV
jgi:hypothetical protein